MQQYVLRRPSMQQAGADPQDPIEDVPPDDADPGAVNDDARRVRPRGPPPPPGVVLDDRSSSDDIEDPSSSTSSSTEVPSVVSLELQGPLLDRDKNLLVTLYRQELNATTPHDSTRRIAARIGWCRRELRDRDWNSTKWKAQHILTGTRLQQWNDFDEEDSHMPRAELQGR